MQRLFTSNRAVFSSFFLVFAACWFAPIAVAQTNRPGPIDPSADVITRIRDEGLNHSQVMATLGYLTDVIGPRLTGSPNLHRANEWTRDKLASWGLENAHLEAWGRFGRGWSLQRFSAQVIEPQDIPLIGYPKAWSPGFEKPIEAPVVWLDARGESDLEKYTGKLRGAIVLVGSPRDVVARFEPMGARVNDSDLLQLANADTTTVSPPGMARTMNAADRRALLESTPLGRFVGRRGAAASRSTTQPSTRSARQLSIGRLMTFLQEEGAALVVSPSTQGDGGTLFVAAASLPGPDRAFGANAANQPHPWSVDAPACPAQITLAVEHYNRLVHMIQAGEKLKMAVDLQVKFHSDDLEAYNTIAEIPGSDLKDQIVMVGAHMDSWHSATGATDNGAGVASMMEAVRILRALNLQPRRTVRIALWTGEEEGLFGSKGYVTRHFGYYPEAPARRGRRGNPATQQADAQSRPARKLIRESEYENLSVYFNLDNGTGKIRGVYMQGNDAVRPIFRSWLTPFKDLGASTLTLSNTGGTDHLSFDAIGLPGFQFIQDPIEYFSRTHHSNQDLFDRIQADDLKQASTIIAAFVYQAAMMDQRMPRKPLQ